jgi:hypothetical protein
LSHSRPSSAGSGWMMLSAAEAEKNFYFREGDPEHLFEFGQKRVPEWRGRSEIGVLLDRVANGLKPIARPCRDHREDNRR